MAGAAARALLCLAHVNVSQQQGNAPADREHRRIWISCRNRNAVLATQRLTAYLSRSRRSLEKVLAER